MNRKCGLILALLILSLAVAACGGGSKNKLIYRVEGDASKARVEYKNAQGDMVTETVALPWETTLDIGGDFSFKIDVENESQAGQVACGVWVNDKKVGQTTGNTSAGCVGSFHGDNKSFTTSFSGYRDTASKEATPEPTEEPEATADTPPAPVKTLAPITDLETYEHDMDCSAYSPELTLRAFSILYPSGATIQDCAANPENYVAFGFDPDGDTENPAFALAVGRFNSEPPDLASYTSNGARLLGILTAQIESQYDAETISGEPIFYQGVTLFYEDFVTEIEGTPRLLRMVAVPNLNDGHGALFFAMQKTGSDYEQELPEFDRLTRGLIASLEFLAVEPTIGSITFAADVTADDEPVDPNTTFPVGILKVFGVFEFSDFPSGAEFEFVWFREGEADVNDSIMWTYESSGQTWVNIDNPDGLGAGVYELELFVDGELLQTGSFVVEGAPDEGADAQAWYDRGIELYDQGAFEEALAAFSQAIELDPGYVYAYNSRALTLVQLGELEDALADLNQALELDSGYAEAYNTRGETYRIQGDLHRAIADFDQGIALDPDYALPYYNRGRAYRALDDLDRALDDLDQALELDPELADAYFERGIIYHIQQDWEHAIADFDQAIALDPSRPAAYLNRGVAHYFMGELDSASADFSQAIELRPDYDQAYMNRGHVYKDQGDTDGAIADFRQVLEVSSNSDLRQGAEDQLEALGAGP